MQFPSLFPIFPEPSRHFYRVAAEVEIDGFTEILGLVETVEPACEPACEFKVLFLVFAYRHEVGMMDEYVHGHEGRIGEQSSIDAAVGLVSDDFLLYLLLAVSVS